MSFDSLVPLGWTADRAHALTAAAAEAGRPLVPLRVVAVHRTGLRASDGTSVLSVVVPGRLHHHADDPLDLPVVGDWIAALPGDPARVIAVLPRHALLARKAAGRATRAQALAANVDVAFVVTSLNHDLNPRRVERTLAIIWESGAQPVVVLNKSDLHPDPDGAVADIEAVAPGVPVHALSAETGDGVEALARHLRPGLTAVLLGMSGVGKSTLTNRLAGRDVLAVRAIRERDDRGVHTTTHRELVPLPGGANLIDTPGMREFLQWDAEAGADAAFDDIEALAAACRFVDCRHDGEPGCAVEEAVEDGSLDPGRLDNHRRIERELAFLARKQDARAMKAERSRWKAIQKSVRKLPKRRDRDGR